MSDPMDAYWKKRQQQLDRGQHTQLPPQDPSKLPHYQPAHANIQQPQQPKQPSNNNGWKEMDLGQALMAKAMTGQLQGQQGPQAPMQPQQSPQQRVVYLREGQKCYRQMQTENFAGSAPIVVDCGNMSGIGGKQFEYKGKVKCIVVEGNNQPIDLSQQNHNTIVLAKVSAPFVGTLLVPENALAQVMDGKKQVLKG